MIQSVEIMILNYNGEKLLPDCLPSICESAKKSRFRVQVTVIDNGSSDASVEILSVNFPSVKVVPSENRYLCSFNDAVRRSACDAVILMNNDVRVDAAFVDPLISGLEEREDAFLMSPICYDFEGKEYSGGVSVLIKKMGWWGTRSVPPDEKNWTISMGVCFASLRTRFLELAGFDDLYLPGTLEDLDLGYRAWKRGWRAYCAEKSIVFHVGQASFKKKFGAAGIRTLATRNSCLFIWKNIHDPIFITEHFLWLIPRLVYSLFTIDLAFFKGTIAAFAKWRDAWLRRKREMSVSTVSDRQILEWFS